MNQVKAYFILNLKMYYQNKLPFAWSILLPTIFLIINKESIQSIIDLRFWWTYIIFSSYLYGVGIHALTLRESGSLKTFFSIDNNPIYFFIANVFTQIFYSFVCTLLFNVIASILFKFNFIFMTLWCLILLIILIPITFLGYNLTLIKKSNIETVSLIMNVFVFFCFILMGYNNPINQFNPIVYYSNIIYTTEWYDYLTFFISQFLVIILSLRSIIDYSCIPNERR